MRLLLLLPRPTDLQFAKLTPIPVKLTCPDCGRYTLWSLIADFLGIWRIKRFLRFRWQKIARGFSDDLTWNLHEELAKWLLPRLKRFRELANGYPSDLTPETWKESLDKMILALEIELYSDELSIWKMYSSDPEQRKHSKKIASQRKEGFELLSQYISHLWW